MNYAFPVSINAVCTVRCGLCAGVCVVGIHKCALDLFASIFVAAFVEVFLFSTFTSTGCGLFYYFANYLHM